MPKYDQDFKLLCIRLSDEGKPLPRVPGVQEVTLKRYVSNWRLLLGQQGGRGLDNSIIYRDYSLADKIRAVRMVRAGRSYSEAARAMGMRCHSTVRRWCLDYAREGVAGLQYRKGIKPPTSVATSEPMRKKLSKSEREELLALRKRNEILELENEYLKKLDALVSKREAAEAKAKKRK